jgi:acyl-CoA thioester hydrolase
MTSRRRQSVAAPALPDHCRTFTPCRVCVKDTDMMGVVHHANYATYLELGRLAYMRQRELPYKEVVRRGYHLPVIELNLRYRRPARFDDLLSIETRLGALTRATVRFDYKIWRPAPEPAHAPELLAEGHVLLACIDDQHHPRALPQDMVATLFSTERVAADDAGHS